MCLYFSPQSYEEDIIIILNLLNIYMEKPILGEVGAFHKLHS